MLGTRAVEELLARHRGAASLLLAPSPPATPETATRPSALAARLDSHLSHNALLKQPFIDECLDILTGLLRPDVLLVAPEAAALDGETVWLLDKLLQRRPAAFPSAVLGLEPGTGAEESDAHGIVWGPSSLHLSSLGFNLRRRLRAQLVEVEGSELDEGKRAVLRGRAGQDEDSLLLQTFEASSAPPEAALRRAMLGLVRRAFAGHAFEAALLWGLQVRARCPDLEPLEEAELCNIVALSAHNRQFRSTGNERLVPFLESIWRRAWDLETRPAWKSAVGYRLAVTLGRRQGNLQEAMAMADEAVAVASTHGVSEVVSTYLQAWARNIRALLWVRLRHREKAVADTEHALEALSEVQRQLPAAPPEIRSAWERDLTSSWSVLASNRVALARLDRDGEALERWQGRQAALAERYPELELFEAAVWMGSYRDFLRFDLAFERAERGLELAREEHNALWEYLFLAQVADLAYRLGRVERAIEACEAAHQFIQTYGNATLLGSLDLLHAEALGRGGRGGEGLDVVRMVLAELALSPARQVEAHALAARLAAAEGDARTAEEAANAAIEGAVEHGHRDSLLLAAVAAGTASRALGRLDDARDAYGRALALASTGELGDPPPPAGDMLEAHLGVWQHDPGETDHLLQALRLLPSALAEPQGWWHLAPLTAAVEAARQQQPLLFTAPELSTALEQLHLAGQQRADMAIHRAASAQ